MSELLDLSKWTVREVCGLCSIDFANVPRERHHKVLRSQGGDDSARNLVALCKVCHDAVHGIPSNISGHSCETCPILRRRGCHFGEKVTNRPQKTPKPW